MKKQWFLAGMACLAILVSFAFVHARNGDVGEAAATESSSADLAYAQADEPGFDDPIDFPHNVHAGDPEDGGYGIECMYCHFSAERSSSAGIPPVSSCMGCHSAVRADGSERIDRLTEFWDAREPIPWNRVYKVADHVQFPHMRHISAGVDCAMCHGNVEEMGVIEQVQQPLTMGWCLDCHMEMGASRDCTVCHY